MTDYKIEEGELCPSYKGGYIILPKVENCSCHLDPPCIVCTENLFECDNCFLNQDELEEMNNGRL